MLEKKSVLNHFFWNHFFSKRMQKVNCCLICCSLCAKITVSQLKVNERTLVNTRCSAKFVIRKNFFLFSYLLFYYHMKFTSLLVHEWLTKFNLCCRLVFPPRTWIGIAFWLPFLPEIIQSWFFTRAS